MRHSVRIGTFSHRSCRIELLDVIRAGWQVVLYPPPEAGLAPEILRMLAPDRLDALLGAARSRADTLTERILASSEAVS